jgi:hypothetical protein
MLRILRSDVGMRGRDTALRFVIVAYAVFSLADWITTATALALGARERNPIAASLYSQYGAAGLLLFKVLVVTLIVGVLVRIPRRIMSQRVAVWVVTAFVVITAVAVIGNVEALRSLPATGVY